MKHESLVAPTELRDFAKSLGWSLQPQGSEERLYILNNAKFPRRQLVFPRDLTAPDYEESMWRILGKLGEMMGVLPQKLLTQAQSIGDDTLRFRIYSDHDPEKSLPLSFANSVVSATIQLLKAAACSVVRPRLYHPRLAFSEALQLLEKAQFGHTESGSFVLKVSCPIHALDVQTPLGLGDADEPFVRRVTHALYCGLEQLVQAIESDTLDEFVELLKQNEIPLISSNLCEAITQLHDENLNNSLDINFDWSDLHPIPMEFKKVRPIRFQRDYFGRIEEVRRELRPREQHEQDTYVGTVEKLEGEMGEDGHRSGDVILSLLLPEGESIRARATLSADMYLRANAAHMHEGAYVKVSGRLNPGRQPRCLSQISNFELIENKPSQAGNTYIEQGPINVDGASPQNLINLSQVYKGTEIV